MSLGWALPAVAVGIAVVGGSWALAPAVITNQADHAASETVAVAPPTEAVESSAREVSVAAEPRERGAWNALFFSPELMLPMHSARPQSAGRAAEAAPAAEAGPAVPMPPIRPGDQASANTPSARPTAETARASAVLDIAGIKRRLRLTAAQEAYWKPVEAALHAVAREQARGRTFETLSAETAQNLYWAAAPLVGMLREDQKAEARNLVRSMGLERVASLI